MSARKEFALEEYLDAHVSESSGDVPSDSNKHASSSGSDERLQELVTDYYAHDKEYELQQHAGRALPGAEATAAFGARSNQVTSRARPLAVPGLRHLESVTINLDSFQESGA